MCCQLLALAYLAVYASAARPTSKTPIVQVGSLGFIRGQEMLLSRSQRSTAFLGIPYAQAPTESNRFKEPQKPWPKWDGTKDATEFKPSCLQPTDDEGKGDRLGLAGKLNMKIDYDEDCLFLNIYVPDGRAGKNEEWPVVIWFHPGDFIVGSPNIWDGSTLAIKQKVIIVTASYRLNIFGFLATQDNKIPGNAGLLDQIAVMEWVQEHIRYFNGSKDDITLWGHSAGGISVSLHLLGKRSSEMFHRAIIMSGNFLTPNIIKSPMSSDKIIEELRCNKDSVTKCLETAKAEDLLKMAKKYDWGPTMSKDNEFITMMPEKLILEEDIIINNVPVMTGYTDIEDIPDAEISSESEFKSMVKELVLGVGNMDNNTCLQDDLMTESVFFYYLPSQIEDDKNVFIKQYMGMQVEQKYAAATFQLAKYISKKSDTYVYRFDYKLKTGGLGNVKESSGVPQQHELPFFWGMPYWSTLSPQITWNSQDKRICDVIMGLFGNFTKYSKPAESKRSLQWDPIDITNPHIFIIDKNPNMSDRGSFDYKSLLFWNDYYPRLKNYIKYCCSLHSEGNCISALKWLLIACILLIL